MLYLFFNLKSYSKDMKQKEGGDRKGENYISLSPNK